MDDRSVADGEISANNILKVFGINCFAAKSKVMVDSTKAKMDKRNNTPNPGVYHCASRLHQKRCDAPQG